MSNERLLEIRTYRIADGQRDEFGRRVAAVVPMLSRYGIDLVGHGPSIEDEQHYVLLRSFASLDELNQQEAAFYGGEEWQRGPRDSILEHIETYHTVVLRSTEAAVRALADSLGTRVSGSG
ncbi:MAG: NIPSNAP family protein [Acidimicrobiales bacterium]